MSLYQEYEPTPDNPCEIKGFRWLYENDRRERMKLIELLNKIAKGEEVPEKIKWGNDEWKYSNGASKNYYTDYEDLFSAIDGSNLNDELEIIEDEEYTSFNIVKPPVPAVDIDINKLSKNGNLPNINNIISTI